MDRKDELREDPTGGRLGEGKVAPSSGPGGSSAETKFRQLFESMNSGVAIYEAVDDGADFRVVDINPAGLAMVETPREEAVGRRVTEAFPGVVSLGLLEVFREVWRTGEPRFHPSGRYCDERLEFWAENRVFRLPGGEVVSIFEDVTERRRLHDELTRSRDRLRGLHLHLADSLEEERRRIARELHDELGQKLTGLSLELQYLRSMVAGQPEWRNRLNSARDLLQSTVQTTRKICTDLRPRVLDDLGLVEALHWLCDDLEDRGGLYVQRILPADLPVLPDRVILVLFRTAQEAITNLLRHAQASQARVTLAVKESTVRLEVRDDGLGMARDALEKPESFGLRGMRERVETLGGELQVEGAPGMGTSVRATLPLAVELEPSD